nr:hypothetical protein [Reticulibacter mediterranei]
MNLETLTLWSQESLANLSAMPGSSAARLMTVTSGRSCSALYDDASPVGWLSRTLMTLPIWRSTSYRLIWKVKVTPCKRLYFRLAPSMPRTSESAALLWRTPTGSESAGRQATAPTGSAVRLSQQVFANGKIERRMWPTPVARDHHPSGTGGMPGHTTQLAHAVKMWPTPNTGDAKGGASTKNHQVQLCYVAAPQPGSHLNPEWVECLMGVLPGWTACAGLPHLDRASRSGNPPAPSLDDTAPEVNV